MTEPEAKPAAAVTLRMPNVKRLWQRATLLWNGTVKFILNLVAVLAFLLFVALLYRIATERSIVIEPISVPQSLAANGYTPEVAARRLRDALTRYHEESQTMKGTSGLTLHSERPSFVVPTVGLSSEAIATFIRDFFDHPRQQQISGEFTIAESKLWLRLRQNGQELYTSTDGVSPSDPDALFALAAPKIFELLGEPYIVASTLYNVDRAKGLQMAKEIIAGWPKSDQNVVWSYILIGLHLSSIKDHDHAIEQFNEAIHLDPKAATAFVNRGLTYLDRNDRDRAIADLTEAIRVDSKSAISAIAFAARGKTYHMKGDLARASVDFNDAIRIIPKNAQAFRSRGIAHAIRGDIENALADFTEVIRRNPKSAMAFATRGSMHFSNGNLDRALADFNEAIRLGPQIADVFVARGRAHFTNNDKDRAIADYTEAIRLDPKNVEAFVNRGTAYSANKENDRAIDDYNEAIRLDPTNPFPLVMRGEVHFTNNDNDRAIADYRDGLAMFERRAASDPSNADWQRNLSLVHSGIGDVLVAQGKLDDALKSYRNGLAVAERVAVSDRGNTLWQGSIGRIGSLAYRFVLAQNFAQALEASDLAIAVAPDQKWLYMNRAHALMFLDRADEARTIYLRYRGEKDVQDGKPWETLLLEDFDELRKAGLTHPLMDEIEKRFAAGIN
jgi:tetratricopeptide (TPR) repeat protein